LDTQLNSPLDIYFDQGGATASYFSALISGSTYIFDVSDPNRVAVTYPNGNSLIIDQTGISFFSADCSSSLVVSIVNFTEQIDALAASQGQAKCALHLYKRRETNFFIDVALRDQCGIRSPI
jgi:hypothetical protein